MQTKIETKSIDGLTIIAITGRLDAHGSEIIKEQMHQLSNKKRNHVLLNLNGVAFIDSSGLGLIVSSFRRLREQEGEMSLCCMNPQVQTIFELTRLHRVFNIFEDESSAVSSLSQ
jgi:anti-sigma B factor antagonist